MKTATKKAESNARIEIPISPQRVHELRLALKRDWHRGLRGVAMDLGISDTMLIFIEKGKRPITPRFAEAFLKLEHDWEHDPDLAHQRKRDRASLTVVAAFPLPARLELLRRPIKCDRCGNWIMPTTANQKRHRREICKGRRRKKK